MFTKNTTKHINRTILASAVLAVMPLTASAMGITAVDAAYNGEQASMATNHTDGATTFIPKIGNVMVHPAEMPKTGSRRTSMDVRQRNFPALPDLDA